MNRREFLTLTGAVIVVGALGLKTPQTAEAQRLRKLYRGTADGKLEESVDGGKTWQQVVNFGEQYSVNKVTVERSGAVNVQLGYMGGVFDLCSPDALIWRTVEA